MIGKVTQRLHHLIPHIILTRPPGITIKLFEILNHGLHQAFLSRLFPRAILVTPDLRRIDDDFSSGENPRRVESIDDFLRVSDDLQLFGEIVFFVYRAAFEFFGYAGLPFAVA